MVELEIDSVQKQVREVDALLASEMIGRHSGALGTLCFVVRRPGAFFSFLSLFCRKKESLSTGRAALTRFLSSPCPLFFFPFSLLLPPG
jgi:hypothetical protein